MEKTENPIIEAEEVKVAMLENTNNAESNEMHQKSEKHQYTRKPNGKESAAKQKVSQKLVYLRANKGLVAMVLISAAIIFAIVVAMLATDGRGGHHQHLPKAHNITKHP